jgi:hypothetical protein
LCWEASADGCITQVSFIRLLPYPPASLRFTSGQLVLYYPQNHTSVWERQLLYLEAKEKRNGFIINY